jgi:hypothetical protein
MWSQCGANGSLSSALQVWKNVLVRVAPGLFPPELVVQIKAWACELPSVHQVPLSRWSTTDLAREVCQTGLVASISGSTLWRWLHQDAIRPWYHRSWIFPKDPEFGEKAGRLLDLYSRQWEDKPLKSDEFVICADEKTSFKRGAASIRLSHASLAMRAVSRIDTNAVGLGFTSVL